MEERVGYEFLGLFRFLTMPFLGCWGLDDASNGDKNGNPQVKMRYARAFHSTIGVKAAEVLHKAAYVTKRFCM